MYTTSRYPSAETKDFAKRLAKRDKELYAARGKKTIEQLVSFARKKGEDRIRIVRESRKKPVSVSIVEIDETGGWKWAGESEIHEG